MNLLDHEVLEIISKPSNDHGKWWLKVKADCYGSIQDCMLMFYTYEECLKVHVGYKFLA